MQNRNIRWEVWLLQHCRPTIAVQKGQKKSSEEVLRRSIAPRIVRGRNCLLAIGLMAKPDIASLFAEID